MGTDQICGVFQAASVRRIDPWSASDDAFAASAWFAGIQAIPPANAIFDELLQRDYLTGAVCDVKRAEPNSNIEVPRNAAAFLEELHDMLGRAASQVQVEAEAVAPVGPMLPGRSMNSQPLTGQPPKLRTAASKSASSSGSMEAWGSFHQPLRKDATTRLTPLRISVAIVSSCDEPSMRSVSTSNVAIMCKVSTSIARLSQIASFKAMLSPSR